MKLSKVGIIATIALISSFSIFGQNERKMKLAQHEVDDLKYADAIEIYESINKKTPVDEVKIKIAECYVKLNDPVNTTKWFDQVEDKEGMEPLDHYSYAQSLASLGKFEEAKEWYSLYENEATGDLRAHNKVYALEHLDEYYKDSAKYEIDELKVLNTENSEFSPAFYKDGIVFPSSRVFQHKSKRTFKWDNSNYLDLFYSIKIGETPLDYDAPVHFSPKLNTKFHEGALTFDKEGNRVIFTRNNYFHKRKRKDEDGVTLLKLYYAEHTADKDGVHGWHDVVEMPFNSNEYSVVDPSANEDFTILYFASNMPGGYGGADIYKSEFKDGKWTEAVNLGPDINTEGDDRFPFIHKDGTLYFASDGRGGIGGLDIYEAKPKAARWDVHDIGYPINSPMDDFGFILSETHDYGYFSSNRFGGTGNDDIYEFIVKNTKLNVTGDVFVNLEDSPKENRTLLPGAEVIVYNKTEDEYIDTLIADANGRFSIEIEKGSAYEFRGTKDTLLPDLFYLDLTEYVEATEDTIELTLLEPLPDVIRLQVDVRDKDSDKPLPNSTVYLMDLVSYKITSVVTDSRGVAKLLLDPDREYVLKGTKIKYLSDCMTINSGKIQKEAKTTDRPLYLELFKVSQKFKIENVYFDSNKDNIRPDAAIELDKVVEFILANPGITVELGSHTDSRGTDAYNLQLSERRAKSSRAYIVSQGVAEDVIAYKGYGETELANDCSNGVTCTAAQHQANRRTEIKITGIKELSPEEEKVLEANKKGLSKDEDLTECEPIGLKTLKE